MKSSDLVLVVLDSSRELEEDDLEILDAINPQKTLVLINKIDLESRLDMDKVKEYIAKDNIIPISAMENKGLESIHDKIEAMVYEGRVSNKGDVMITNTRHKDAIYKAMNSINDAIKGLEDHMSYDFIEVDLKDAWDSLGFINGDTVTEDLLDTIFKNFCIGK